MRNSLPREGLPRAASATNAPNTGTNEPDAPATPPLARALPWTSSARGAGSHPAAAASSSAPPPQPVPHRNTFSPRSTHTVRMLPLAPALPMCEQRALYWRF